MVKKHTNAAKPTKKFAFGAYEPVENADKVNEMFFLANRYRNDLIAIELEYRKQRDTIVRKHSADIRDLEDQLDRVCDEIVTREKQVKASNQKARKQTATDVDRTTLQQLRRRRNAINAKLVAARRKEESRLKQYYDNLAEHSVEIARLRKEHKAAKSPRVIGGINTKIRALSQTYWQDHDIDADMVIAEHGAIHRAKKAKAECQLHWPTEGLVTQAVTQAKKDGPRFRRYDGSGTIGGALNTTGGVTVESALAGDNNQFRITEADPRCTRGHAGRLHTAWLRIGSEKRKAIWAAIPFVMHREIPGDAQITNVVLTRKRVAGQHEWELQLSLNRPQWNPGDLATGEWCAIDLNWRQVPEGLRVAAWGGTDGEEGNLIIPTKYLDRWKKVKDIQSIRDTRFDEIRATLDEWIKKHDIPEWLQEKTETLGKWRSQRRLAKVIHYWREHRFPGDEEMFLALDGSADDHTRRKGQAKNDRAKLEHFAGWRNWDRHLYEWECHLYKKAIRWRRDTYRKFAAEITRRYKTVLLEDIDWHEVGMKPEVGEHDLPHIRRNKPIAAVAELAKFLVERASDSRYVEAATSSSRCNECGKVSTINGGITFQCEHCGYVCDRDRNAWLNLLMSSKETWVDAHLPKRNRLRVRKQKRAA